MPLTDGDAVFETDADGQVKILDTHKVTRGRGQAGVILVGHPTVEGAVEGAFTRATEVKKQGVEASADAIQDYVEESDNPI